MYSTDSLPVFTKSTSPYRITGGKSRIKVSYYEPFRRKKIAVLYSDIKTASEDDKES